MLQAQPVEAMNGGLLLLRCTQKAKQTKLPANPLKDITVCLPFDHRSLLGLSKDPRQEDDRRQIPDSGPWYE